jgi:hypothetical protein
MANESDYRRAIDNTARRIREQSAKSGKPITQETAKNQAREVAKRVARRNDD